MERSYSFLEILRPLINLIIGIIFLVFIKVLMAIAIPSFEENALWIFTYIETILKLVVNTLFLLLLLNFGREGKKAIQKITKEEFFGDIFLFTIAIITSGLAHWVYKPVFSLILGRHLYIYSIAFFVMAGVLIVMLGVRMYKNLDKTTGILLEKIKGIPDLIRKIEK